MLTTKQAKFVEVYLAHHTVPEVAAALGVTQMSVYRMLAVPAVAKIITESQAKAFSQATGTLKAGTEKAARRLLIEVDSLAPNRDRIRAAEAIFIHALRVADFLEVREELRALKQQLAAIQSGQGGHG